MVGTPRTPDKSQPRINDKFNSLPKTGTKRTHGPENSENEPRRKNLALGEDSPPNWTKEFRDQIREDVRSTVTSSMKIFTERLDSMEARVEALESTSNERNPETDILKKEFHDFHARLDQMTKAQARIDDETRKGNLLFLGIKDGERNMQETRQIINDFISQALGSGIKPLTAYRFGKINPQRPRPINAKFSNLADRDTVLRLARGLPNSPITVKPDLCAETREMLKTKWEANQNSGQTDQPRGSDSNIPGPTHRNSNHPNRQSTK